MTKKMIAVDLDGTLLNGESKLSDFTKETIKKISKKGHHVAVSYTHLDVYKRQSLACA